MRLPFSAAAAATWYGKRFPFNVFIRIFGIVRFLPGVLCRLRFRRDRNRRHRHRRFFRYPLKGICCYLFNVLRKGPADFDTVQEGPAPDFLQQAVGGKNDFLQFRTVAKGSFSDFLHTVREDHGFQAFIAKKCIRSDDPDTARDTDHFAGPRITDQHIPVRHKFLLRFL